MGTISKEEYKILLKNKAFKNRDFSQLKFDPEEELNNIKFENCKFSKIYIGNQGISTIVGFDFGSLDLSGSSFINCDLRGSNFLHAKLEKVKFKNCNTENAEFIFIENSSAKKEHVRSRNPLLYMAGDFNEPLDHEIDSKPDNKLKNKNQIKNVENLINNVPITEGNHVKRALQSFLSRKSDRAK